MQKLLIILFFTPILVWGQSKLEIRADKLFNELSFESAIDNYKLCLEKEPDNIHCILKMANCYQELNDFTKAEEWYSKAFLMNNSVEPVYKYNYAYCLYTNGKNNEAKVWFLNYNNSLSKPDKRAQKYLESIKLYKEYFVDTSFIIIHNLNINSATSDFPSAILHDELAFVSNKNVENEEIYNSVYTIYFSGKDNNTGKFSSRPEVNNRINTQNHIGPIVFYNNYANVMVSQASQQINKKDNTNYYSLQLFEGEFNKEQRTLSHLNRIKLLDATNSHPAVNKAGTKLIFSSNINVDKNGMDLFISIKNDGAWGLPERLGNGINTNGDEVFPFLLNDTILYFTSNGHGGLGGLDIFKINLNQPHLGIENLGYPVNSSYDDFSIVVDSNGIDGYFASNRPGGKGDDDIYSFEIIKVRFKGLIKNKENNRPISNVKVLVSTSEGDTNKTFSDSEGNFEVILSPKERAFFEIYSDNYIETKVTDINPITKNKLFYLEPKKNAPAGQTLVATKKPNNKKKVQSDSVRVFLEIVDPYEGRVISSTLVPGLWVDKKVWDTFIIEHSK